MNLILPIHVESSTEGGDLSMLALRRLSLYLDNESDAHAQVLEVAKRHRAAGALETLSSLHLEPDSSDQDIRRLLEDARSALGQVLDDVRTITADWISPGIDDLDAPINWSGARLQDILATLDWALGCAIDWPREIRARVLTNCPAKRFATNLQSEFDKTGIPWNWPLFCRAGCPDPPATACRSCLFPDNHCAPSLLFVGAAVVSRHVAPRLNQCDAFQCGAVHRSFARYWVRTKDDG